MKQTAEEQYEKIRPWLPVRRGNVRIPNIVFINAKAFAFEVFRFSFHLLPPETALRCCFDRSVTKAGRKKNGNPKAKALRTTGHHLSLGQLLK